MIGSQESKSKSGLCQRGRSVPDSKLQIFKTERLPAKYQPNTATVFCFGGEAFITQLEDDDDDHSSCNQRCLQALGPMVVGASLRKLC